MKTYEERLHDAHTHAERMIMALLYSWEVEDFPLPEGSEEFDNMRFWRTTAQFPYLKRVAALFAGRPPSQVEDERHFSQTGVIITARRARLYPDHVERKYLIARCIEFFGFMAYPDLPREECMPNPLLRPRDPLFTFAQFGEAAFQKTRLTTIPENFAGLMMMLPQLYLNQHLQVMKTKVERSLTWMTVTSTKMIQSSSA